MEPFDYKIALSIFAAYLSIDWLYTLYTLYIVAHRKFAAANVGLVLYILSAYGVINFVGDWRYVAPMCVGGWFGTYLSLWYEEKKKKSTGE